MFEKSVFPLEAPSSAREYPHFTLRSGVFANVAHPRPPCIYEFANERLEAIVPDRLAETLSTDIDWVRPRTKVDELARRWLRTGGL